MTAPYAPELAALITRSLEHYVDVTAVPANAAPFPLDATEVSVTFSEDWSPHIQAQITAAVPASQAQLDALDGRALCRVHVRAGYIHPDLTEDVHDLANLGLRVRGVPRPADTVTLEADSDEFRAQERVVRFASSSIPQGGMNETLGAMAVTCMHPDGVGLLTDFPAGYRADVPSGQVAEAGDNMWSLMADIAASAEVWLYVDGNREWNIRRRATLAGTPAHELKVGQDGTIITSTTSLDRDEWFNDVVLRYRWKNGTAEQDIIGRATVTSGAYSVNEVGYRTKYVSYGTYTTQTRANSAARTMLSNLVTRGRSLQLTAAAAYWLRPGATVRVTLPTGDPELHLVQSVTFRPIQGLMDITTRQPLNVTITTGE